ncbi:MAG: hypothetical protein ABIU63_13735 [Chitinophagaceae bacterium]
MDLNHIELPPSLLTDFYRKLLVESPASKPPAPVQEKTATKKGLQYLGKNQKGICILVDYAKDVYLPDEQLNFLTAILQACHLNLGDVAIVNRSREKISLEELKTQLPCHQLLAFGVSSATLGLGELPMFTVHQAGDCTMVFSPAAEQLNQAHPESKVLKSKLWNCLKQLFNV